MKRKKHQRKYLSEVSIFPLSVALRNALWISLDLLNFVKDTYVSDSDLRIAEKLCARLFSCQKIDGLADLELTPKEVSISSAALSYAVEYLDGVWSKFDHVPPTDSRLPNELSVYNPSIRILHHEFSRRLKELLNPLSADNQ